MTSSTTTSAFSTDIFHQRLTFRADLYVLSWYWIARQTGVSRMTVRAWLTQPSPPCPAGVEVLPLAVSYQRY